MRSTTRLWLRVILFALVVTGLVSFLISIGDLVRIVIIAGLLAYLLDPCTRWLEIGGLHRTWAATVVFCTAISLLATGFLFLWPLIEVQLSAIQVSLMTGEPVKMLREMELLVEENFGFLGLQNVDLLAEIESFIVEQRAEAVSFAVAATINLLLIPFLLFFLLRDGRAVKKSLISTVPNRYFEFTLNVIHKADLQLGFYLRGKLLDALLIGILATIILWLLDVDFYIVVGVIAGLTNIIPYVGPILGGAVAVVVAAVTEGNTDSALGIIIAFSILQLIDNTILQPLIISKNVKLHPITVVLAVVIGGKFFGVLGLFLGVPVVGVLKIIIAETRRNLHLYQFT